MSSTSLPNFDQADIGSVLSSMDEASLDALDFGVIGFDADTVVCLYNAFESRCAGLSRERVVGHPLFTTVAPCMNNFLVAQRFEDAAADGAALDATIEYVLTLRMRPVKVRLRLVAPAGGVAMPRMRYVLVCRPS
jgi:photoactive yellow protein